MFGLLLAFAPLPKKPLAPEPVLGYNTWNAFQGDIHEDKIKRTADLMVEKGLLAAGYNYLIIDDGYLLRDRDADGKIIIDSNKFPSGMKAVADYVHSKGLKFGMYNSAGTSTCMGLAGSFGHEDTDAQTFADFGVDFLKYDFCYNPIVSNTYAPDINWLIAGPRIYIAEDAELNGAAYITDDFIRYIGNNDGEAVFNLVPEYYNDSMEFVIRYHYKDAYRVLIVDINGDELVFTTTAVPEGKQYNELKFVYLIKQGKNVVTLKNNLDNYGLAHYSYMRMGDALINTGHDITFAVCEWGSNQPYKWAQDVGHMWRTSYDITGVSGSCNWATIISNYETTVNLYKYSGENAYNDPDMLCIGLQGINYDENKAHMSLWSITNSPLLIGADLDKIENQYVDMLKNEHMLRINQDKLHIQAMPIVRNSDYDILLKPLDDGNVALLMFNKKNSMQEIRFDLNEICNWFNLTQFETNQYYRFLNVWNENSFDVPRVMPYLQDEVPAHGVYYYMVKPI